MEEEEIIRQMISAKDSQRISALNRQEKEKAAEFARELANLLQKYQQLQINIRAQYPEFVSLTQAEPIELTDIQKNNLDHDSVLLKYILGDEKSYVFIADKDEFSIIELAETKEIEDLTRKVLQNIKERGVEISQESGFARTERIQSADLQAKQNLALLSEILLEPFAAKISDKRLLIVSSGVLQYLPFAALPIKNNLAENKFLIETNDIVYLPSASVLPFLQKNKKRVKNTLNAVGILADPVFTADDIRLQQVKNSNQNQRIVTQGEVISPLKLRSDYSRLRFTRREAEAISSLIPDQPKFVALDFAANLEAIHDEQMQKSRILHLATHGIINSQFPELSGLVLSLVDKNGHSQEGILRLYEIYNLQLEADLVVLSACETALGKEIKGEGLIGLSHLCIQVFPV